MNARARLQDVDAVKAEHYGHNEEEYGRDDQRDEVGAVNEDTWCHKCVGTERATVPPQLRERRRAKV